MPPTDEPGRRSRMPRHGEPDTRRGGPGAVDPVDDPYGDVSGRRSPGGRHGTPADAGPRHGAAEEPPPERPRHGGYDPPDDRPGPAPWPPPTALPHAPSSPSRFDDGGRDPLGSRHGSEDHGSGRPPPYGAESNGAGANGGAPNGHGRGAPGQGPSSPFGQSPSSPPYGQPPASPPYGQAPSSPYGQPPASPPHGQAPSSPPSPYGQAPASPPYGKAPPAYGPGRGPSSPAQGFTGQNGYASQGSRGAGTPGAGETGPGQGGSTAVQPAATGGRPASTAVQPPVPAQPGPADEPLLAGGTPPPVKKREEPAGARTPEVDAADDEPSTTALGAGSHRRARNGAASGPGRGADAEDTSGPGRRSRGKDSDDDAPGGKKKRKGSFWRELPLLIVVAIVLTFVIQTFIARIYVIPSASMEQTLHGCGGCANDRVAVDKVTYRFSDPSPGDVVVFKGPQAWLDNDEVGDEQPSSNALIRGFQDALSLVGLAAPNEKDFVKRVIATGGQTVACCDTQNHVLVNGKPINEPYLYFQPGLGDKQATFDPVRVPDGQLWVMGDNRNNSADARFHGPVPVSDVIGKVRVVVLPISRWRTVPAIDPQATTTALGGSTPLGTGTAGAAAGALLAVPVVGAGRRLRRAAAGDRSSSAPPRPGDAPGEPSDDGSGPPPADEPAEPSDDGSGPPEGGSGPPDDEAGAPEDAPDVDSGPPRAAEADRE